MEDTYLTPHFRLSEFTRSATATKLGIDNSIPESLIPNLRRLCTEVLEPLRAFINSSTPPNTSGVPKEQCSNGERKNDKALHYDSSKSDSGVHSDEQPIIISSGYRCPALNKAVGGAKRSYHLQGRAADIPYRRDWYLYIRDHLPHTELINESTWIHIAL